ncbi:MAG: Crp/Fnr family transcriptional regulator [Rubrivivax sp.]|nr:Crp/Fnr family transcriptional regulator [Rubrivivax sp.]
MIEDALPLPGAAALKAPADDELLHVAAGSPLPPPAPQTLWRLRSGAVRLCSTDSRGGCIVVGVALPGDLIGAEALAGAAPWPGVQALTASAVTRVAYRTAADEVALLTQALQQCRRQQRDLALLRTGPASERIKALLLVLSAADPGTGDAPGDCALPALRDMAAVVDSAPETVSRVIGSLRRLDVLHDRRAASVRVDRHALHGLRPVAGMTSSDLSVMRRAAGVLADRPAR